MPHETVDKPPGEYERVVLPAEAWRHVVRRVRQLDSLRRQQDVLIDSLVDTIAAMPDDDVQRFMDDGWQRVTEDETDEGR